MPASGPPSCRWLVQDLSAERWDVQLPDRIDCVIHLAQSRNYRDFPAGARRVFAVAADTTLRLADWALGAGARQFILASTGGLYGASDRPVREDDELVDDRGPLGFYFASKRASELVIDQYSTRMHALVLRCFFVYGSGQPEQMLMPRLVDSVRNGRPVTLQGSDGIHINPIHVDDAARAVERCLEVSKSSVINIAGPEPVSLRFIAERIGAELGTPPVFAVDQAAKPRHLVADIGRMRTLLGAPTIGVAEGIRELCAGTGAAGRLRA
jgi:nucleoside-diphosphate-sugar epimerase